MSLLTDIQKVVGESTYLREIAKASTIEAITVEETLFHLANYRGELINPAELLTDEEKEMNCVTYGDMI